MKLYYNIRLYYHKINIPVSYRNLKNYKLIIQRAPKKAGSLYYTAPLLHLVGSLLIVHICLYYR